MEIRKRRKPHEPREVKQPKMIKWELTGIEVYEAKVGLYNLLIYEISHDEWEWRTSLNNPPMESFHATGFKPTKQQAKNAAVFKMTKHKRHELRKIQHS